MDEEQLAKAIGWAGLFLRWSPYAGKTSGAAHAMALDADVDDRGGLIGVLIFYSCEERWAWDAPSAMTQAALRNRSGPLSYQHANWAADMLAGKGLKPKAGGKRLAHRDLAVAEAIVLLGKNRGLKPTRSRSDLPNCCAEGGSACDAVGVASRMNYKVIESPCGGTGLRSCAVKHRDGRSGAVSLREMLSLVRLNELFPRLEGLPDGRALRAVRRGSGTGAG